MIQQPSLPHPSPSWSTPSPGLVLRALQPTASVVIVWEEIGPDGQVIDRWERDPIRLHCVFRFEMGHLLARAGFQIEAPYGDFFRGDLQDQSMEMVWVAQHQQTNP